MNGELFHFTNQQYASIDAAASPITVYTPGAANRLYVMELFLQAEADVSIQCRSSATAIGGPVDFTAATARERHWGGSGFPIFRTVANGNTFNLAVVGAGSLQINGWAVLVELPV